jgi:Domain of unknown function (DUF4105)
LPPRFAFKPCAKYVCKTLRHILWIAFALYASPALATVSLIFASGYLGNPASYFGHVFLKHNVHPLHDSLNLYNPVFAYGAETVSDDPFWLYAWRGLTGGYFGGFGEREFYVLRHDYGQNQLRDLWEFELELDSVETARLLNAVDTGQSRAHRYYFLGQNCVTGVMDVLDKSLEPSVDLPHGLTILPIQLIEALAQARHSDGRPYLKSIGWYPSRESSLNASAAPFRGSQSRLLKGWIRESLVTSSNRQGLPPPVEDSGTQAQFWRTLLAAFDVVYAGRRGEDSAEAMRRVWDEQLQRMHVPEVRTPIPVAPEASPLRAAKYIGLGIGLSTPAFPVSGGRHSKDSWEKSSLTWQWRPWHHSAMQTHTSHAPFSALELISIEGTLSQTEGTLTRFDLWHLRSLHPNPLGLPGVTSLGWETRAGYAGKSGVSRPGLDSQEPGKSGAGHFLVEGVVGPSYGNVSNTWVAYAFGGGQGQVDFRGGFHGLALTRLGIDLRSHSWSHSLQWELWSSVFSWQGIGIHSILQSQVALGQRLDAYGEMGFGASRIPFAPEMPAGNAQGQVGMRFYF